MHLFSTDLRSFRLDTAFPERWCLCHFKAKCSVFRLFSDSSFTGKGCVCRAQAAARPCVPVLRVGCGAGPSAGCGDRSQLSRRRPASRLKGTWKQGQGPGGGGDWAGPGTASQDSEMRKDVCRALFWLLPSDSGLLSWG